MTLATMKAVLIMRGPDGSEVAGQLIECQHEGGLDWAAASLGALRWERLPDDFNIAQPLSLDGWGLIAGGPQPGHPLYDAGEGE